MKKYLLLGLMAILLAFTGACTPETPLPPTPSPRIVTGLDINLLRPYEGDILGLSPITVVEQVTSSTCCINRIDLIANGHSVLSHNVSGSLSYVWQTLSWMPAAAGQYYLQGQAHLTNGSTGLTPAIRVCVFNISSPIPEAGGYLGPCAIPTRLPSAASTGTVSIDAFANPNPVTILPIGCTGRYPTFTITANITDPADQVFLVYGVIEINGYGNAFHLNWYASDPGGVKRYHGTFTPPNSTTSITEVRWFVTLRDRHGQYLDGLSPTSLTVYQGDCQHEESATSAPLQIIPSATPGNLIANVQAYPSPIYYGNTCPSVSTLSFRAALMLPPGIVPNQLQVLAHVNVADSNGNPAGSLSVPLMPNGTFDTASGGSVFLGNLDLSRSYTDNGNNFDPASLGGANGSLKWYIDVANQNTEMGRSSDQTLNLSPCPTYAKPTSQPSGNTCNLSAGYCQNLGKKLDTASCSCVP